MDAEEEEDADEDGFEPVSCAMSARMSCTVTRRGSGRRLSAPSNEVSSASVVAAESLEPSKSDEVADRETEEEDEGVKDSRDEDEEDEEVDEVDSVAGEADGDGDEGDAASDALPFALAPPTALLKVPASLLPLPLPLPLPVLLLPLLPLLMPLLPFPLLPISAESSVSRRRCCRVHSAASCSSRSSTLAFRSSASSTEPTPSINASSSPAASAPRMASRNTLRAARCR